MGMEGGRRREREREREREGGREGGKGKVCAFDFIPCLVVMSLFSISVQSFGLLDKKSIIIKGIK